VDLAQVRARGAGRVGQALGGAGGGIHLLAVMHLGDLDVEAETELAHGLLDQLGQDLHTEAHVRRPQHRHALRSAIQRRLAGVIEVGRTAHDRDLLPRRQRQQRRHRRRHREVDHHVCTEQAGRRIGRIDDADLTDAGELADVATTAWIGVRADSADDLHVARCVCQARDGQAHATRCPEDGELHRAS
jgi:hypothetical protein